MAPRRRERRPGVSSRQPQSLVGRATASSSTNLQAIPTLAELGRRGHGALEHADVDLELRLLGVWKVWLGPAQSELTVAWAGGVDSGWGAQAQRWPAPLRAAPGSLQAGGRWLSPGRVQA